MQDSLGDRMKCYEGVSRTSLVRRMPVIIRLDGKAFHTITRGLQKPFDLDFRVCMDATALQLCQEVQGVKLAYAQSDEISLLLTDYDQLDTQGWFDYGVQKMVSVAASVATWAFNRSFGQYFPKKGPGFFDARAFNVPREDVANYFVWRQKDAIRNSIQAVGQANYSQRELQGRSCDDIREMLLEKNVDCDMLADDLQRGSTWTKHNWGWGRDVHTPLFTKDRKYIEQFVFLEKPELVFKLPPKSD